MKKLTAVLLTLCLMLGLMPGALAESAPEAAALPQVGDVVHGFEAMELREAPLVGAQIVRFEHQKTGAQLFYIANDDTNRVFDLTFFTDAIDDTGLPHVFEHATLAGSEKYPSEALFFNLSYQTYNTYMNASTSKRFTTYPVASLSEAQLLRYADYYTDSCFHPMIMENEDTFRTEAWRYRLADPEDELTLEGTVYSEMKGAWSMDRLSYTNALKAMFPGSLVCNEPGGDPDCIPDMTWDALKSYHDLYYHPSNCAAYLYGRFEDYAAFLELLDGYFSEYERKAFVRADDGYTPIAGPVVEAVPFPVEQGSNTEHAAEIYYGFVCPGLRDDPQQELVLSTLTDLLSDTASSYQQSLQEALPYGFFGAFVEKQGPDYAVLLYASNVNAEDADTFKATADAALAEVVENGFPQDQVDGAMASLNIAAKLSRENSDPVNGFLENLIYRYVNSGNPWALLDYQDGMFRMDEWNRQGLYTKAVSDWLIDNQTTVLVTTYPEPGAKEEKDAALAAKLAEIKAGMSEEEIAAIVAASNAEPAKEDSAEFLAQLKAVTVESLPEEFKLYDVTDVTGDDGIRRIDAVANVEGVGQASVFLDAAGLPQEELHWLKLYTDLIGELDTTAHTKAELARLFTRYLYNGNIYISLPRENGEGCHPYLRLIWIAMDDDLDEGYDLMRELLFDTKVDDTARIAEQVQALKANAKSTITSDPANTLIRRAMAITNDSYRLAAYISGLTYYDFLCEAEQLLADDPDAAVAKLEAVKAYFNNSSGAVTLFAGNAESIALNRELSGRFLDALDEREITPAAYDLPVPAPREALVIDSGVQYNLLMADFAALGLEGFTGDLDALFSLVSDTFLVPLLRDQYGVYAPQNGAFSDSGVYIYAYRDPNIAETFDMLETLPELVSGMELDQETLDGYILSSYSNYAKPGGELSGAIGAALDIMEGVPQDEELTWMRELKQITPEKVHDYADMYAKLAENGRRMTAGAASAINANAERFDAILNPFGAVDKSQIAFDDAAEGSDHYEAVRFAFENGLMLPLGETAFGVDEPATEGDLLAAMHVLVGGETDPGEALAAFAELGLVGADDDLATPVTAEEVNGLLGALVGDAVSLEGEENLTRAGLAEMLMSFMEMQG